MLADDETKIANSDIIVRKLFACNIKEKKGGYIRQDK
jgi:hypothetical protein